MTRAIQQVLSRLSPSASAGRTRGRVLLHSYAHDFPALWSLDADKPLGESTSDDTIIVMHNSNEFRGDDLPEARKHLTALDWALWFGMDRLDQSGNEAFDVPKIVIVESSVESSKREQTDADRFFSMFPERRVPALPWILTVQSLTVADRPCCLVQLLKSIATNDQLASPPVDLSMVRQIWQSFFLRPT